MYLYLFSDRLSAMVFYQEMSEKNTKIDKQFSIKTGSYFSTFLILIATLTVGTADKAFNIPFSQLKLGPIIAHGGQAQVCADTHKQD